MMKKIDSYIGIAPKLSETGSIKYCLWIDSKGAIYIQLKDNEASGTFSKFIFSVSKYQSLRDDKKKIGTLEGYDIEKKTHTRVKGNNNGAFLKAALKHLLPECKD